MQSVQIARPGRAADHMRFHRQSGCEGAAARRAGPAPTRQPRTGLVLANAVITHDLSVGSQSRLEERDRERQGKAHDHCRFPLSPRP